MKYQQALDIIEGNKKTQGFMVMFHHVTYNGCSNIYQTDFFPDKRLNEPLIPTREHAWVLAQKFADATGNEISDIYVADHTYIRVKGEKGKIIKPLYFNNK